MEEAGYLVVARFLKAHGLQGEALVASLTDDPETVLVAGRRLIEVNQQGEAIGPGLTIARSRVQRGSWLLGFREIETRTALEQRGLTYLGARREELRLLGPNAMYLHEIPGAQVVERGDVIGVAREVVGAQGAELLVVEANGKEHLIPFRAPILKRLDRAARRIEVELPPGLLEL
ncbi:MAG: 16S rRNA processing protein RimM [Gemmatimonadetes bacterium]|nr:16S rRNA processing protein RimM [Gemmatimonadota bacterium]